MLITNFRLKYVLYQVVLAGYQLLDTGRMHPVRERARRALESTVDYVETNLPDALGFDTQKEVLAYAMGEVRVPGHYLEFGVFTGGTMRYLAGLKRNQRFDGFDSFEGLPEAWGGFNLGPAAFSRGGKLPRVPSNVVLHKGWFSATVPAWAAATSGPVAFVHIDCDLYSSTVELLDALRERFQAGTVVVFDEYFNYPNWERGEAKAWREFVERAGITYEYLAYARQQVALRITAASP
jgi:hypothetical protein